MRHFLDMIDSARTHGITIQRTSDSTPIRRRAVTDEEWGFFENCQPFVFSATPLKDKSVSNDLIDDKLGDIEDAPFPIFSVEIDDPKVMLGSLTGPNRRNEILVMCIMAVEVKPQQFLLYVYVTEDNNPFVRPTVLLTNHSFIMPLLEMYMERMTKEQMGLETSRTNVKLGTGASKKMHRIRRIIHVAPKSVVRKGSESTRSIDWTHRFEVRGHWRKHEGVGKDRSGNYTVHGWTWVSNHTRGPEHMPLIKKVRTVEL